MSDILVSVIIPVYNVAAYIESCARSLYEQTYQNIEFIWVDDATPDNSIELLEQVAAEYPNRNSQSRIITHIHNRGLPSARNTGLYHARGEYIFHCDSDDYVNREMISDFVEKAVSENADIVYSDWYLSFAKSERYMKQPSYTDPKDCVRSMLAGSMRFNVWNKLVKRSIYEDNQITFPDGFGMGEDMTMIKLFAYAQKVAYIGSAYYHYMQVNPQAFTKVFSEAHWQQLYRNVSDIKTFIERTYGTAFSDELHFFALNVKLPLLISSDYDSYERWLQLFPESNAFIPLNVKQTRRTRWLQQIALKRHFRIVRMYYVFIIKVIYGIVYRQ